MTEEPSEMDIHAYIDDQLDPGRRFAIESHLSDHPALAAEVMGELSSRTALRLLCDADSKAASDIPASMAQQAAGLRPSRRPLWRKAAPFGGVAIAAAISGLLLVPDGPPSYVGMAVESHRVAMMRANMISQIEAPALNSREIMASTQIDLPSLPDDWHVTDVQVFPTEKGPALIVAVKTQDGSRMSLFALRQRSDAPEIPDAIREGSQSVAYWRRDDMSYALTGDGEPNLIDMTAEGLNKYWS